MRYAVTGAAGFIGSHLTETLVAGGHEVVGIDCFTDYYDPALKEENARGARASCALDLAEDELDFAGFDGVFHLAAQPGVRSFGDVFPLYLRRNVLATQRLFEAAARDGVKVVFASSSSVYGAAERYPTPEDTPPRPLSPYGITKLACEHLADAYGRSFGLDCVVLRYFNAFGPRQRPDMAFTRIALALAEGSTFELFGDGDQSRGWTYVSDVVDATVAAMCAGTGTYNVGGAIEASMNESIELLERISGRTLDVRRTAAVPGDQRRTNADTTRIRAELGWEPASRSRTASRDSGNGPRLESRWRDERRPATRSTPGAEREIDLARWRRAVVARWWIVLAASSPARRRRAHVGERRPPLRAIGAARAGPAALAGRPARAHLPGKPSDDRQHRQERGRPERSCREGAHVGRGAPRPREHDDGRDRHRLGGQPGRGPDQDHRAARPREAGGGRRERTRGDRQARDELDLRDPAHRHVSVEDQELHQSDRGARAL